MQETSQVKYTFDPKAIRAAFPVLDQEVNGKPLIYFDNAATNQKPGRVVKALTDYYEQDNANIHRGVHALAERATNAYEATRKAVQDLIHSAEAEEVIFTKGTSESINLVAQAWGSANLKEGDEIIISTLEHHSNIVPWQMLCERTGAILQVIPINDAGELLMEEYDKLLSEKTKIVSVNYVSNSLGTINPVEEIIQKAHARGAVVMLDAAQAIPHLRIDVQKLNADFMAFSSHKIYGPTGVGILYGKRKHLEAMPPYQGGGEMIAEVTFEKTTYNEIPYKFEAGTPNIADVVALNEAISFMQELGIEQIAAYEEELMQHVNKVLGAVPGMRPVGTAAHKASVYSFLIEGMHPFDIGMMLDARGIAVRTGHHCTQPLMARLGIEGTVRASFAVYNTKEEIDALAEGLHKIAKLAGHS